MLSVLPPEFQKITTAGTFPDLLRLHSSPVGEGEEGVPRRKKRMKGWDGESLDLSLEMAPLSTMDGAYEMTLLVLSLDLGSFYFRSTVYCTAPLRDSA